MNIKLTPPCETCPFNDLPRKSETCMKCEDRVAYSKYIGDPRTFFEVNPDFKYSFEYSSETDDDTVVDDVIKQTDNRKFCPKHKGYKDKSEFYKNISTKDGLSWSCKECTNQAVRTKNKKKTDTKSPTVQHHTHRIPSASDVVAAVKVVNDSAKTYGSDFLNINIKHFPSLMNELKKISEIEIRGSAETQALWFLVDAVKKYQTPGD